MARETWVALPSGSRRLCLSLYCLSVSSQAIDLMKPAEEWVPTRAVLVHHPSLMNAGEECRAVALLRNAEAGPHPVLHELRLGKP